MLILAVLMLPVILLPEFVSLSSSLRSILVVAEWTIWAAFALELGIKTYLSPSRRHYLVSHWYDVVIVVVPFLRPLRIARSVRLLRSSRGLRLLSFGARLMQQARTMILSHGVQYAVVVSAAVFFSLAGLALIFEQQQTNANIRTYGDAIWWAIATITTVGYGDRFPVTTEGRAISVFIMLLGISLFSLVTASVAAMFVRPSHEEEKATLEDVLARLEQMEERLLSVQRSQEDVLDELLLEEHPPEPE